MPIQTKNPVVEQGATIAELSVMFVMDTRDVRARLKEVPPSGRRDGVEYWRLRLASPYLMPIDEKNAPVVSRLLAMNSNSLPPVLRKEYWAGRKGELDVLAREGSLWDTKAVVDLASSTFKTIRISMMLLSDALERETGLTEAQRTMINERIDSLLNQLRDELINVFHHSRENTQGKAFASKQREPALVDDDDDI